MIMHSCSLLYIFDTNFLFFIVFQAIQASLLIDFGQEGSQDQSQKKKEKIVGPFSELEQVPVAWEVFRPKEGCSHGPALQSIVQ